VTEATTGRRLRIGQKTAIGGALIAAVAEMWFVHRSAAPGGIVYRRFTLFGEIACAWALFAVSVALLWRVRSTRTVVIVAVVLGVLLRLASFSAKAPLSDDLYRYAWDGQVQLHGTDPYRYAPLDTHLKPLRTNTWLFPVGSPKVTKINRPTVRTIYPPVAEVWFTVTHPVSRWHDRGYEALGLLVELAVLAVLLALLKGERRRQIALYALCPLPILEAVQNAHVDGLAVLFSLLAMLALRRGRGRWATVALAAAALVKLYPALLLPVVLRGVSWRERLWRGLLFIGAVAVAYLPHVVAVGPKVLGYLPGYLREEQYSKGGRYLLVDLLGIPDRISSVIVVLVMAAVVVWVWRSRLDEVRAASVLFAAALLLATPVQPWYALTLAALVAVSGEWWLLGICAGAYGVFFGTILDTHAIAYGRIGYGAAAVLCLVGSLVARHRRAGPPARGVVDAPRAEGRLAGQVTGGQVRRW
jgi:alpha-1,2-mannosyltransferase